MKHLLFPMLLATVFLADVAPSGCGRRNERPLPPPETTGTAETPAPPSES